MSTKPKIRLGFIGVGGMGQCAHLRYYATDSDCEVVALTDLKPKLAEAVARKYGVPRWYTDGEAMIAREKLDALVVTQYFGFHGSIVTPLYRHGLPILTEKPLAHSIAVGEQMLAALRTAGTWHMIANHKRSDPATMYAHAEIQRLKRTNELGALRYVRITMPPGEWIANGFFDFVRTDEPTPNAAADPAPADMNEATFAKYVEFVNFYIHQVNLLRYLLGEPYRLTYADQAGRLLVAETDGGATGIIEMAPYQTTADWQESALVGFDKGWIKLELPAPVVINQPGRVTVFRDPGQGATPVATTPVLPAVGAMRQQATNFLRAIKGEIKPPCDAVEALEDLKIARAYLKLWKGV